ncbi:CGNR zinc finger domain-containing protein [Planosporangium sp. 12N6]|uniref:CGNR zinc finger domain-containing protein n=1 Tax=Planosporangium spinosum TaxID=3402278 RepID=UPI003CEA8E1C
MQPGVPESLWLVESLLNSVDTESGQDDLDALPRFRRWLRDHGRAAAADAATEADLTAARDLRGALRDELAGRGDRSRLDRLAAGIGLVARFAPDGGIGLAPIGTGVPAVLGEVLAAVVRAAHEGTWRRLKICSSRACRYVYYDRSKNGSRRWCSMEVCGNRSKTRAYRERVRPARTANPPAS